jgi:hypothetical protein
MPSEPPAAELKVLKRKDPTVIEDEWPQFDLYDAEVRDEYGELTSLFNATPEQAVTLTGIVHISKATAPRGMFGAGSTTTD